MIARGSGAFRVAPTGRQQCPVRIDVLTTFPELFTPDAPGAMGVSIPGRARASGALDLVATDIRAHADNKHQKTDDRPFGGGPGMVMMCQPVWDAAMHAEALDPRPATRVMMTPEGQPLRQALVEDLAREERLLVLCGHYEGIDERVVERLDPVRISIGDYVLSSGELAAMVLIDAVARLLPGVLGDDVSAHQDSFGRIPSTNPNGNPIDPKVLAKLGLSPEARLLDCPHYTRPRVWEGMEAPEELFSGDHDAVLAWRLRRQLERTRAHRPDLLDG